MSRKVFKYPIEPGKDLEIRCLKVCLVGLDPATGDPAVWAEVNDEHPMLTAHHTFRIVPTGLSIPDKWEHVGSVIHGPYVWHVYRVIR